jgi:phospholipase C
LKELADKGANLSNFFAITHPSYPNYLALTAGSTFGINTDGQSDLDKTNIVDLLETAGISWKVYAEQYPDKPCYKGVISNGYVRKHLPMLSFVDVQNNAARCAKVVPATQLTKDVVSNNLPQYSLYIPDLDNDGHDTGVGFATKWLKGFLPPLQDKPNFAAGTLVVITFDEGLDGSTNQIYTVLSGEPVKPGSVNNTRYTHYDLLRTIEDNFKLGNLGREDAKASFINGVWKNYP